MRSLSGPRNMVPSTLNASGYRPIIHQKNRVLNAHYIKEPRARSDLQRRQSYPTYLIPAGDLPIEDEDHHQPQDLHPSPNNFFIDLI